MHNRMARAALLSLSGLALFLSGCATQRPAPPPPPSRPTPVAPVARPPATAARYVATAASASLYELRASEMAQRRTRDSGLLRLASMALNDHRGISGQLAFAGRRLDLIASPVPLPVHARMLDELSAATDFDATYRRQQARFLPQLLAFHRDYARRGASPTLRPVAIMAAPLIQRELAQLRAR